MAKRPPNEGEQNPGEGEPVAAPADAPAGEAAPTTAAPAARDPDKRFKKLTFPDPATGEPKEWKRIELIRYFCTPTDPSLNNGVAGLGWSRSEATAKIKELSGDPNFRYQIVFQATKGINGVKRAPKKEAPAAVAAAPASDQPATS